MIKLFIVIGIVAIYRWSSWIIRYIVGRSYRPAQHKYIEPVSVVFTVFNEKGSILDKCLNSVLENNPDEVIIVVQEPDNKTFHECVNICKRYPVKLIIIQEYGKRVGLAIGIKNTKNDIISLIDSDVIWSKDLLEKSIRSFNDKKVGAVLVETRAHNPHRWNQYLMDTIWNLRNNVEFPFLARFGIASVISGRTALYRKDILTRDLKGFLSETFLGYKLKSGDDKFFTRVLMRSDKIMAYQPTTVYSEVPQSFIKMMKQYMRWQRNSWRSDIKLLLSDIWFRKDRFILALYLLDRMLGKLFLVIGTIIATYSIVADLLIGSIILLEIFIIWWVTSRILKVFIATKNIQKVSLIYVFWVIFGAFLSLLALMTISDTGWHTREGVEKNENL